MALGKTLKSLAAKFAAPQVPASAWRPIGAVYPALHSFEPVAHGLTATPGLIAVWHLGVRPQWLKVAAVTNLEVALKAAGQVTAITSYKPNGGVYVAWALTAMPAGLGHAVFLMGRLQPVLQAHPLPAELPIGENIKPVEYPFPPGTSQD
jgi:hypothetical protein